MEHIGQATNRALAELHQATTSQKTSKDEEWIRYEQELKVFVKNKFIEELSGDELNESEMLEKAFEVAAHWLCGVIKDPSNKHNWLHIRGDVGTGKTTLGMAVYRAYSCITRNTPDYKPKTALQLVRCAISDEGRAYFDHACETPKMYYIDDIGKESVKVMYYGTMIYPIIEILDERYHCRRPTIYSTNLNGKALRNKYNEVEGAGEDGTGNGTRLLERITERTNAPEFIITLTGESNRKGMRQK